MVWGLVHLETEIQAYSTLIFAWNTLVRFGYLLLVVALLARLRFSYRKERERSRLDPLTGLLNVRGFQEIAGVELKRTARLAQPISVIFMDCDDLKGVNDRHGHAAGDDLLQAIARCIRAHIREYDIAGRLGGDEFAVILPGTGLEEAQKAAERISAEVARASDGRWAVTLSAGVVTFHLPPGTVDDLLNPADALLYKAKAAGKNRIHALEFGVEA